MSVMFTMLQKLHLSARLLGRTSCCWVVAITASALTRSIEVCLPLCTLFAMAETLIENVNESQILAILRPMIKRYAFERLHGERFGDFTIRAGYISAVKSGKEWYDGMGGEGKYAEALL